MKPQRICTRAAFSIFFEINAYGSCLVLQSIINTRNNFWMKGQSPLSFLQSTPTKLQSSNRGNEKEHKNNNIFGIIYFVI